tara:strand:+ start:164 stop:265 length:102 start_codon:yes stop_codon:yes gene_type:complete
LKIEKLLKLLKQTKTLVLEEEEEDFVIKIIPHI